MHTGEASPAAEEAAKGGALPIGAELVMPEMAYRVQPDLMHKAEVGPELQVSVSVCVCICVSVCVSACAYVCMCVCV